MNTALLKRTETGDEGTFGFLMADSGHSWVTGELPWRDLDGNGIGDPKTSCITTGVYICEWAKSPRFGWCYHVRNVSGRSEILIHAGNYVGDKLLGFRSDVLGCIVLGKDFAEDGNGQKIVVKSREALTAFENEFGRKPFELTIVEAFAPAAEFHSRAA